MIRRPRTITINLVIISINAFTWLGLGIIIAVNALPGLHVLPEMKRILAFLSTTIAVILLVLAFFLYRHNRNAYFLTLGFFGITSILTIFNEVRLADIAFLLISLLPILLLIKDRSWYLQKIATNDITL